MVFLGHWDTVLQRRYLAGSEEVAHEIAHDQVVGEGVAGAGHDEVAAPFGGAAAVQLPYPLNPQLQAPVPPAGISTALRT